MSFNVLSAVQGYNYPTGTATVYTDLQAVQDVVAADNALNELPNTATEEEVAKAEAAYEDALARLEQSPGTLTFHLRAVAAGVTKILAQKGEREKWDDDTYTYNVLARLITHVTNGAGDTDNQEWTAEKVQEFYESLLPGQGAPLIAAYQKVQFDGTRFEVEKQNPDF